MKPKGSQKGTKREPTGNQNASKIRLGARLGFGSEKWVSLESFSEPFSLDEWISIDFCFNFGSIFCPSLDVEMMKNVLFYCVFAI